MPFLVVGTITVPVATGQATQRAPQRVGSSSRMYSGALRSTVRHEKRSWSVVTNKLTTAEKTALLAEVANGVFLTCSGDLLGASVVCEGTLGDVTPVHTGSGIRWVVALTLQEV